MKKILILALILTGSAALADRDPNRPTDLIAAALQVEEATFLTCFDPVQPAADKAPSGARQHMNKSVLLPCLQEANPDITNARLDSVMDQFRPEGPIRR